MRKTTYLFCLCFLGGFIIAENTPLPLLDILTKTKTPSYETPLRTIEIYLTALKVGDYDIYRGSLTGAELDETVDTDPKSPKYNEQLLKDVRASFKKNPFSKIDIQQVTLKYQDSQLMGLLLLTSTRNEVVRKEEIKLFFAETENGWKIKKSIRTFHCFICSTGVIQPYFVFIRFYYQA